MRTLLICRELFSRPRYSGVVVLRGAFPAFGWARCHSAAVEGSENSSKRRPRGAWNCVENRSAFMDELEQAFGIESPADWAKVTTKMVRGHGGGGFLSYYRGSLQRALQDLRPLAAEETRFLARLPSGHWDSAAARREFVAHVAKQLGIEREEQWKTVTKAQVCSLGGSGLLDRYGNSLYALLEDTVERSESRDESHGQSVLAFGGKVPRRYWDIEENRRDFVERFAIKKGITDLEGWKDVTVDDIRAAGGNGLLQKYSYSVFKLLQSVYKEMTLEATDVRNVVPRTHWDSSDNIKCFFRRIAIPLSVHEPQDWYRVSAEQVIALGGKGLLSRMTYVAALSTAYPDFKWEH